jgi:GTP:adenosylcobinamide-phosphate guanylyltransferase
LENAVVNAIVLAGGNAKGLAQAPAKGLVPINGRPMVEYVLEALIECKDIDRICVVMPVDYSFDGLSQKVDVVVTKGSLPVVAKAGLDHLGENRKTLVLGADVPMISPESISDFLNRCKERDADFYYPIVRFGESEKQFPDVKRTYARVREGRFTGGNIGLIDPSFVYKNISLIEHLYDLRKSPFKLASFLGFGFLLKFLLGMLSMADVEKRFGKLTDSTCMGVITPYIEIGIDVDKESDLKLAAQVIGGSA